jgi:N-acetylneuraminate synthase
MKEFVISGRKIGLEYAPFVMAEVGINHEGEYSKAIRLVDAAKRAGADCVKFQCHITENEMIYTDMKPGKISKERLWDIIKRCELTEAEETKIMQHCRKKKIMYLSTPFSREAADRLDKAGVPAFKIGSGECNNFPLIEHIASKGKPVILSTGMNNMKSIRAAVNILKKYNVPVMLMHCVSIYPTPYNNVRLPVIQQLRAEFGLPVGLSDHSLGIYTSLGAVALGAVALEKHFTIKRSWPGPDNPISIEPDELNDLVKGSRAVWEAMNGLKEVQPQEKPVINFAYACVVTISSISKGDSFTLKNIWVKRPGTGDFLAKDFNKVLKMRANKDLVSGIQLRKEDVR